jgi:FkbM family methyltransferase
MKHFYSEIIRSGDICFDVGANEGAYTSVFLELGAKVLAIEPSNNCINILKKKFGNESSVTIIPKALGSENGKKILRITNLSELSSFSDEYINYYTENDIFVWNQEQEAEITTIDDLIAKFGKPQFCKIDVEGFEEEVLKGLSISIPNLSFEFLGPFKNKVFACIHVLKKLGEPYFNYSTYENMHFELSEWQQSDLFIQTFKSLPDLILHGDIYVRFKG